MTVTAPFQFARIPRTVWFPDWGKWVSHDVAFEDGYSGTIEIEIEAMTPLLIGGERRAPKKAKEKKDNPQTDEEQNGKEGEVWPVRLPGKAGEPAKYAIPGSSLQGMIRNILEVACFGKLGPWVEQRRFGIRDISGSATGTAAYGSRMTGRDADAIRPKSRSGCLQKGSDGKITLMPCDYARVDSANITALAAGKARHNLGATLTGRSTAPERYDAFLNGRPKSALSVSVTVAPETNAAHSCGPIWYTHCTATGPTNGTLVFTGKPVAGDQPRRKHYEFVFYDKLGAIAVPVPDDVWRDFALIHSPPKGSGQKENPNWAYWEADFNGGAPVPIFYIEEVDEATGAPRKDTVAAMGTAFMFKLAHTLDTHQMLDNSSDLHRNHQDYDLPSLIFGGIGDGTDTTSFAHSLKRRASFEWAVAILPAGEQGPKPSNTTVLLSPKPSYYPIYVRQPTSVGDLYASYTPAKRRADDVGDVALARYHPELSGAKVWPSPSDHSVKIGELPGLPQGAGNSVAVKLNFLPAATKFSTTLHVHNLRKVELGALLWALTLGDKAALAGRKSEKRHRIGMGKPYGLGSVTIKVKDAVLIANANKESVDTASIVDAFVKHMDDLLPTPGFASHPQRKWTWIGGGRPDAMKWIDTLQVKGLLEAAEPDVKHPKTYMLLGKPSEANSYVGERNGTDALLPLARSGWELSRIEDGSGVPVEAPPAQHRGGNNNRNNPGGNHHGGGQNQVHRKPQPARAFRAEKGCPVKHDDGRTGEISKIVFGRCYVQTEPDVTEDWPTNSFIVTGPPEL